MTEVSNKMIKRIAVIYAVGLLALVFRLLMAFLLG